MLGALLYATRRRSRALPKQDSRRTVGHRFLLMVIVCGVIFLFIAVRSCGRHW
jgi:hypothetical protein